MEEAASYGDGAPSVYAVSHINGSAVEVMTLWKEKVGAAIARPEGQLRPTGVHDPTPRWGQYCQRGPGPWDHRA
jgi:hypothetical protein